jgi:UDP-glucuronate decarboxylase
MIGKNSSELIDDDLKYITNSDLDWGSFENTSILVTGANGMLPAYLVETLLFLNKTRFKKPAKVIALVRNKQRSEARFRRYLGDNNLVFLAQDIIVPLQINHVNFVIHAASKASPKNYSIDPVDVITTNLIGTYNILEYAKKIKPDSVLFFSSGEVYGDIKDSSVAVNETMYGYIDPLQVRSCYAEGKRAAETMCVSYHKQFGIPVRVVRPFHTYGPGMDLDDGRVFADFVSNVVNNQDIRMRSDGMAIRPFCYLADATIAFFMVLLRGEKASAYNVANPSCMIDIQNLANTLVNLFPEKKLKLVRDFIPTHSTLMASKTHGFTPDISKIMRLGWQPKITIEDGFKKTILSYL